MLQFLNIIRRCNFSNLIHVNSDFVLKRNLNVSAKDIDETIKKRFYEPEVQKLLKQLTRPNLEIVFRKRKLGRKLKAPEYKFMTTEQIEKELEDTEKRAAEKLEMPPMLPPRKEIDEGITKDIELTGWNRSKCNFIFTDITYGKSNRNRLIVVREPNGTLRHAKWEERDRMNKVYFPVEGSTIANPKLFQSENLLDLCKRHEYEYILDRACLQFEPDDPEYLRICVTVYDHINEVQQFDLLRSTRYYGPLLFHLAAQRTIDNIIIENLQTDRLEDAVWAIRLLYLLKPESNSSQSKFTPDNELKFIKDYIENCLERRGVLEMTYKTYVETKENLPGIKRQTS